jgi:hypothetical protein
MRALQLGFSSISRELILRARWYVPSALGAAAHAEYEDEAVVNRCAQSGFFCVGPDFGNMDGVDARPTDIGDTCGRLVGRELVDAPEHAAMESRLRSVFVVRDLVFCFSEATSTKRPAGNSKGQLVRHRPCAVKGISA